MRQPGGRLWLGLGLWGAVAGILACGTDEASTADALEEGEAVYREGDFRTALEWFREAREEALAEDDSATASVAMTWLGLAHWQLAEYDEALTMGEEALALKERLGLKEEIPRSLNALGLLAWNEGRLDDALSLHGRSLRAARAVDDSSGVARALNNLALVHADLGQLSTAGQRYLEAREIFRGLGLPQFQARVLNNVGALHAERGDALAAERALLEAFELYEEAADPVGEVNALGQLGVVYAAQGDPQRGLRYLDSARVVARRLDLPVEEASDLEQLANIHWSLGSRRLALDLYERADSINEEVGLQYEHGANLRARSAIQRELGNRDLAVEHIERALALHESMGAAGEVLADLLELARLREEEGRGAEASGRLDEADSLARGLESDGARIEVALARAALAEAGDDAGGVLAALEPVARAVPAASVDRQWRWERLRARAFHRLGSAEALPSARRAVDLVERIRSSLDSRLLRGSLTAGRMESYHTLVEILLEKGRAEEAFEVADAARGRELVRHWAMSATDAPSSERNRLARMEDLLVTIGYLDRRLDEWYAATVPADRDAAFTAEVEAMTAERERARLEYSRLLAEGEGPASPALGVLGASRATAGQVRDALASDQALIEYVAMESRLVVFVVRDRRVFVRSVDVTKEDLRSRLRIARALAGDPEADSAVVTSVLGELFDLLVGPILEAGALAGAETLVLVPDGHLSYLPFGALRDRERDTWLVETHVLLDLPSAAAWVAMRGGEGSVGEAASRPGAGFAPFPDRLPASADEVQQFAARHPGATYVGREATEQKVREALESGAVVHAAAHGVMNARNPLFSRIELREGAGGPSNDGELTVHEMLGQRSDSPLVFLSACETGAGPAWTSGVTGGKDHAALSQALLHAGARNVVATLWPVQDAAAARFTALFYDAMEEESVARALARAQRLMLADHSTSRPFYWAAYRVTGKGTLSIAPQNRGQPPV